jgi:hypothetical protein
MRYPEPDAWRRGFLEPMMRLQHASLRAGGYAAVNIADVLVRGTTIPLEQWTNDAATDAGFELVETMRFPMPGHFGRGQSQQSYEPVFVFRKADGGT